MKIECSFKNENEVRDVKDEAVSMSLAGLSTGGSFIVSLYNTRFTFKLTEGSRRQFEQYKNYLHTNIKTYEKAMKIDGATLASFSAAAAAGRPGWESWVKRQDLLAHFVTNCLLPSMSAYNNAPESGDKKIPSDSAVDTKVALGSGVFIENKSYAFEPAASALGVSAAGGGVGAPGFGARVPESVAASISTARFGYGGAKVPSPRFGMSSWGGDEAMDVDESAGCGGPRTGSGMG
ncbi:MAG: hypothetical protein P1U40_08200 [Coxiellaceae bacterium]|nr:hypothetical protein [Coxiellaceae bacterium]